MPLRSRIHDLTAAGTQGTDPLTPCSQSCRAIQAYRDQRSRVDSRLSTMLSCHNATDGPLWAFVHPPARMGRRSGRHGPLTSGMRTQRSCRSSPGKACAARRPARQPTLRHPTRVVPAKAGRLTATWLRSRTPSRPVGSGTVYSAVPPASRSWPSARSARSWPAQSWPGPVVAGPVVASPLMARPRHGQHTHGSAQSWPDPVRRMCRRLRRTWRPRRPGRRRPLPRRHGLRGRP